MYMLNFEVKIFTLKWIFQLRSEILKYYVRLRSKGHRYFKNYDLETPGSALKALGS